MSKENSKRLYDHYIKIGHEAAAKDILSKYPDFETSKEAPKATKKATKKMEEQKEETQEEQKD